jgi:hypothetical protein
MNENGVASDARTALGVPTINDVIRTYMKLRNHKAEVEAQYKSQLDAIKTKMEKLEAWVKVRADEDGVTSFKTEFGTAFLTTVDYASVADWDSLLNFVVSNGTFDMFEKRVAKTAVRAWIDEHKIVPPGVNYGTRLEVNIRKPAATTE